MIPAVVLAAGDSTRMGTPKALLRDGAGRTFVARVVRTFLAAGVVDVVVVSGSRHDEIVAALRADEAPASVRVVRNEAPARGQLSSLWTALDALPEAGVEAVLMTLVDIPLVSAVTIAAVVDEWRRSRAPIVRPAVGAAHGHPVLFDARVLEELRRAPLDEGAKAVVHAHAHDLLEVQVDDPGCIADIDTPEEYRRMIGGNSG